MAKSVPLLFLKSIPPGARWITVHPNGKDAKGQPVLVQPEKNGTYRVIGGAGGKLSFLKLRGVRSKTTYKQEAAERCYSDSHVSDHIVTRHSSRQIIKTTCKSIAYIVSSRSSRFSLA